MIYDAFQKKAIEYIQKGHSVIVAAPTGAGKTVIAEHVIRDCLQKKEKVIYTAPIKALSNQKFRDFQEEFPGQIGILTGDVSINANAPMLIMTTEIFRNKILEEHSDLEQYAWIIFDEIHYLDDYERGSVWEESLIFLPEHMRVLGLSATIPNIDQLAQWLESIHHQPIKIVKEDKRPVPLHFYFQCQGKILDSFSKLTKEGFRNVQSCFYRGRRIPSSVYTKPNPPLTLIKHLYQKNLLPCIYFVFSRKRTEYLAEEVHRFDFLNTKEKKEIRKRFDALCEKFDISGDEGVCRLIPYIERGIAYHHAGMLPTLKEVVERLFTSRMIKVIFTTETFALGINMPARTVIFDELSKYYGKSFNILKTRDFYQMAGRAGRRSIDTEGFVFCRINPHYISPQEIHRVINSEPERVFSRFNASYATLLNLYQTYRERLYDIYPSSFHYYQEKKHARKKAIELLHVKVKLLKELRFIHKNKLTTKGEFAAKIYGYELISAELYDQGILEDISLKALAALCISIVFEPRKSSHKPPLDKSTRKLEEMMNEIINTVHKQEQRLRIKPRTRRCYFHLAPCIEAWIKGESFGEVLKYTEADEGEVVRNFRMVIQLLREFMDTSVSSECKAKMQKLIGLINRDVVDAEKQLRI